MNKTILITGASSGIGAATAKLFVQEGWNVIATMRKPEHETELRTSDHVLVLLVDEGMVPEKVSVCRVPLIYSLSLNALVLCVPSNTTAT
jgi:NAD(P)-dependent dehydrogenase (short-subunit alcohol dehydrogenase family)